MLFPNDDDDVGGASMDVSGLLGFPIGSVFSRSTDGLPLPSHSLLLLLFMLFGGVIVSFLHSVK